MRNSHNMFLNQLRFVLARKRLYCILRIRKNNVPLLKFLHNFGIIKSFRLVANAGKFELLNRNPYLLKVQISLLYSQYRPFWIFSKLVSQRNHQIFLNNHSLILLSRRIGMSTLILQTSVGLELIQDAIRFRRGGIALFFIL